MTATTDTPLDLDPAAAAAPFPLRKLVWWGVGLATLLAAGAGARAWSNARAAEALVARTDNDAVRSVQTVRAKATSTTRQVTLPATLRGRQEALVYARTGGYVKRWTKGIGDRVRAGELLAEIDAPEADQELRQARAALEQVKARAALAKSSMVRWEALSERDAVSKQEVDERRGAHAQAVADHGAAEANVKRLEALEALRRVTAPFDGVVLRRNVEVGTLISASSTNARELYHLAQTDTLKIDLAVPQTYATELQVGQKVNVRWPERPTKSIEGQISRVSPGIDTTTRTRQVEIELPNPDRQWLPGSYVDVQLANSPRKDGSKPSDVPRTLTVPAGVVQFRQDGPRVALVENDRIVLRGVKLGRDLGREVEVLSGVDAKDELVLNPPDAIAQGEPVRARRAEPAPAARPAAPVAAAASGAA